MEIDTIQNKLNIKYYKAIKKYLDKNNLDSEWVVNYINDLIKKNLNNSESLSVTVSEKDLTVPTLTTEKCRFSIESTLSDKHLYKKPWSKLNSIHKILKIKEFINNPELKFNSEQDRENIKDELIMLVKTKVLSKKENVNYSETEAKILSIPNLQSKNGVFYYLSN